MKVCLQLWKQLHIHLSGSVWFCCMKPSKTQKIDLNNIKEKDFSEIINCEEAVKLREAFINGNVPKFCLGCMMLQEYDNIEEVKQALLKEQCYIGKSSTDTDQLKYLTGTREVYFEFTTKCNYRCIYCLHSTGAFKDRADTIEIEKFYDILDQLVNQLGVIELSTTGLGEFTLIPNWTEIVNKILAKYPQIQITMFSNFGRKLAAIELETLTKLKNINVSMDTHEKELFRQLRSGDVDIVMDNLKCLRKEIDKSNSKTEITIACVVNDKVFYKLEELLDFLISENMCNRVMLTPMTLPKPVCAVLNIYPIAAEKETIEYGKIRDILMKLYKKGISNNIDITWSGDLQDFYKPELP